MAVTSDTRADSAPLTELSREPRQRIVRSVPIDSARAAISLCPGRSVRCPARIERDLRGFDSVMTEQRKRRSVDAASYSSRSFPLGKSSLLAWLGAHVLVVHRSDVSPAISPRTSSSTVAHRTCQRPVRSNCAPCWARYRTSRPSVGRYDRTRRSASGRSGENGPSPFHLRLLRYPENRHSRHSEKNKNST